MAIAIHGIRPERHRDPLLHEGDRHRASRLPPRAAEHDTCTRNPRVRGDHTVRHSRTSRPGCVEERVSGEQERGDGRQGHATVRPAGAPHRPSSMSRSRNHHRDPVNRSIGPDLHDAGHSLFALERVEAEGTCHCNHWSVGLRRQVRGVLGVSSPARVRTGTQLPQAFHLSRSLLAGSRSADSRRRLPARRDPLLGTRRVRCSHRSCS